MAGIVKSTGVLYTEGALSGLPDLSKQVEGIAPDPGFRNKGTFTVAKRSWKYDIDGNDYLSTTTTWIRT